MSPEDKAAAAASKGIDKDLAKLKKEMQREVKLLLLGTGNSGKSTIAKQMQILYLKGFAPQECDTYKRLIIANIMENMKDLIKGAKKLNIDLSEVEHEVALVEEQTESEEDCYPWNAEIMAAIRTLWKDQGIQLAYAQKSKFQLSDSTAYFIEHLDRFKDMSQYEIHFQDFLRVRKRTTGVNETTFSESKIKYRLVDVGGQRTERRKWFHCFEDVTAILFVAAMSEYDQLCEEDEETNRMAEALELFKATINNDWFSETPVILFLNKVDLFEEKANKIDLGDYFPDYKGGLNTEKAGKWIRKSYEDRNESDKRNIYVHETTATNTENIRVVFNTCQEIFISVILKDNFI